MVRTPSAGDSTDKRDNRTARLRLDSWKEIADYLAHDVRTAIRWERERGLPVHRPPGGKRGSVFAFTDEIDRWLLSAMQDADRTADRGTPLVAESESAATTGLENRAARHGPWLRPRGLTILAGGLVLLALLGVLRAEISRRRAAGAPAAAVSIAGTQLVALGRDRELLWRHEFGRTVGDREDSLVDRGLMKFSSSVDLDGDALQDLVVSVPIGRGRLENSPDRDELFAFSPQGRVLWSHRLEETLTFGAGQFAPPWRSPGVANVRTEIAAFEVDGRKRIAWAQCHHTWWPAILTVLDASGRYVSRWIHSGEISPATPSAARPLACAIRASSSTARSGDNRPSGSVLG